MDKYLLDYDGTLFLEIPEDEAEKFVSGAFYKLSLKRYVKSVDGNVARFKPALNYLDLKKIIGICEKKLSDIEIGETLLDYIESKEGYVEQRYRLGGELKNHDEKLLDKYEQYKAVVDSAMIRPLRERQMWDSFYLCAMKKASNFSVPGSGKTASVLGVYAYLKAKEAICRIVVICPKNAFGSWIDEFAACFGEKDPLRVLNIHDPKYKNTEDRRKAILYESGISNLVLVNYESVGGVEEALCEIIGEKSLLVFDEVHKIKRVGGEYAGHSLAVAEKASYVIAMTGTPIPNSYLDVYNLLKVLFPDEYNTFFDFSTAMLRNPDSADINAINDKLQPFFCRTTKDQLGVPKANGDSICSVPATENENRMMEILKMKYRKNKLALFIRLLQLESNPKMLLQNLDLEDFRYLLDDSVDADEIDYADYSDEVKTLIGNMGISEKFRQCVNLVESLVHQKKTVVVWCIFVDSIRRVEAELEAKGIKTCCVYGEVPLDERQDIIHSFQNGDIQVLITNPHTLAESVSLHKVCHDAVYFEYSYNLVHLLQSKDRIHRLGLPDGQYTQYHFMQLSYQTKEEGAWSLDSAVYERLKEKEQTMLNAIDNHVLETMPTSEEDLELIFGKLF